MPAPTPHGVLASADPDLHRWIEDMQAQKRSKYTIKHYALTVRLFQSWLSKEFPRRTALRDVHPSELKQYQIWLSTQKGYSKNTLYITVKALQAFYRFLDLTVADDLKPPRRSQGLPKYLTEAEASRLLESAGDKPRSRAIVGLLLYSGLRVGELCALLVPDVDWSEGMMRVRSGKGDKDRLVVVPPKCMALLQEWVRMRPPSETDYLFPGQGRRRPMSAITAQRVVLRAAAAAGLYKRVTPHVLRHTLATTLLRRGGDIRFIQKILGHASIATTQIYTHLDDAQLKQMYERASPDF